MFDATALSYESASYTGATPTTSIIYDAEMDTTKLKFRVAINTGTALVPV